MMSAAPGFATWIETASRHTAFALAMIALLTAVIKSVRWIMKCVSEKRRQQTEVINHLNLLFDKMDAVEQKRDKEREEDLKTQELLITETRLCVSAGVTALDGIIQLGRGTGYPINGPVLRMRDKLQDRIDDGVAVHKTQFGGNP